MRIAKKAVAAIAMLMSVSAGAQAPQVPTPEDALPLTARLQFQDALQQHAKAVLDAELRRGVDRAAEGTVSLEIEYDLDGAVRDATALARQARAQGVGGGGGLPSKEEIERLRALLAPPPQGNAAGAAPGVDAGQGAAAGTRFGPLNLDMQGVAFPERKQVEAGAGGGVFPPFLLSFAPPPSRVQGEPAAVVALPPARYVKGLALELGVPEKTSAAVRGRLPRVVFKALGLAGLVKGSAEQTVKVVGATALDEKPAPAAALEGAVGALTAKVDALVAEQAKGKDDASDSAIPKIPPSWTERALDPGASLLGPLAAGLVLAVVVLLCALLARGALLSLGASLKTAGESMAGAVGALAPEKRDAAGPDPVAVAGAKDGGDGEDPLFGNEAFARSLAASRDAVRAEFRRLLEEAPLELTESFADVLSNGKAAGYLFHLGNAVGFDALQALFSRLGSTHRVLFSDAIESPPPAFINDLEGTALARKIIVGAESRRILQAGVRDPRIHALRETLLKLSDEQLKEWALSESNPSVIAAALKALPVARAAELLLVLPSALSIDAAQAIDRPEGAVTADFEGLSSRLAPLLEREEENSRRVKLLKQVALSATLESEDRVLGLLPPGDFAFRRELLRARVFVSDLAHVPSEMVKAAFERRPMKDRVSILWLLPVETRNKLLGSYAAGSKALEALTSELEVLDGSAEKREAAKARRTTLLTPLLNDVRGRLGADPAAVSATIRALAESLGEPSPAWALGADASPGAAVTVVPGSAA